MTQNTFKEAAKLQEQLIRLNKLNNIFDSLIKNSYSYVSSTTAFGSSYDYTSDDKDIITALKASLQLYMDDVKHKFDSL